MKLNGADMQPHFYFGHGYCGKIAAMACSPGWGLSGLTEYCAAVDLIRCSEAMREPEVMNNFKDRFAAFEACAQSLNSRLGHHFVETFHIEIHFHKILLDRLMTYLKQLQVNGPTKTLHM
jgi:hypothetical protein